MIVAYILGIPEVFRICSFVSVSVGKVERMDTGLKNIPLYKSFFQIHNKNLQRYWMIRDK